MNKLNPILPIRMNNRLKEFEELLLDNMLFKVQNQALGNKNPKWKEWWQIIQEFMEEHIQENMELTYFDECNYQLKLQVYRIAFFDFKYEPPSFVCVEIGTSSKTPTTPYVVQRVAIIKPISPLRGGTSLEIIPLHVQFFFLYFFMLLLLLLNLWKIVTNMLKNKLNMLILHLLYLIVEPNP